MSPGESAIRTSAALVRPLPRAVFRLTGSEPLAYLHDVLSQEIAGLVPGVGAIAAALSPNGRISAEVRVLPLLGGAVVIDAEPEARKGIEERIGRHAGLAGCELSPLDAPVAALRGPTVDGVLGAAGLPVPAHHEAAFVEREGFLIVRVMWGVPGVDLIGAAPEIEAHLATEAELDAARIEAGRPRFGSDFDEDVIVNETPLLERGVAANKGCYPGQESVARIRNLGGVRRMMRGLRAENGNLTAGAEIRAGDGVVGTVTSAAGRSGIAMLRSEVEPGDTVEASGVSATVTSLS